MFELERQQLLDPVPSESAVYRELVRLSQRPADGLDDPPGASAIVWNTTANSSSTAPPPAGDADHVYVQLRDTARLQGSGVWVKPTDVYRASPDPST